MTGPIREKRHLELDVLGITFQVEVLEIPFREGVELRTMFENEIVRVSDRQLGEREALRLLEEELQQRLEGRKK